MELYTVKNILEAILLSVDKPVDLRQLDKLFEADDENRPSKEQIMQGLQALQADYQGRGMELAEVSSGYRIQVREDYTGWISRLWEEKAPRYSRALLETLVLIAYRQPITRGEIEEIRGVSVSTHIMKTLQEREWVRVLGHKDVPGKPSMYGTTSLFLDYFNLKSLDELPPLSDIQDLDKLHPSLQLDDEQGSREVEGAEPQQNSEQTAEADSATENTEEPLDTPNDAYEAGVEEADEKLDETLQQEALAVARASSTADDMDEMSAEISQQDELQDTEQTEDAQLSEIRDMGESSPGVEESSELDSQPLDELPEQDESQASEQAEAAEPKPESDDNEEVLDDPMNSAEVAVEDIDDAAEHETSLMFTERSAGNDRDESSLAVEESPEQDDTPVSEQLEIVNDVAAEPEHDRDGSEAADDLVKSDETETLAGAGRVVEPESESDDTELEDDSLISAQADAEEAVEDADGAVEQETPLLFIEPSEANDYGPSEVVEDLPEQDDMPASEQFETTATETMAVERDDSDEPLEDLVNSDEASGEYVDEDEAPEKEKQALSYEPSETAGGDEPVAESPEQDIQPAPERGGWTKLAQMLWERLKKLMQKSRKRLQHDWGTKPGLLNF